MTRECVQTTRPMARARLAAALFAAALAVTACGGDDEPDAQAPDGQMAEARPDAATDDREFLTQLMLLRGHVRAGNRLYRLKLPEQAVAHMKHPQDELYAGLLPAMEARGAPGFADALQQMADAVAAGKPAKEVGGLHRALTKAVTQAARTGAPKATALDYLHVAARLTRIAADEYAAGVRDGEMAELHEYQDAWGATRIAINLVTEARADAKVGPLATRMQAWLDSVNRAWPQGPAKPDTIPPNGAALVKEVAAAMEAELAAPATP